MPLASRKPRLPRPTQLGLAEDALASAIVSAAYEVVRGGLDDHFPQTFGKRALGLPQT